MTPDQSLEATEGEVTAPTEPTESTVQAPAAEAAPKARRRRATSKATAPTKAPAAKTPVPSADGEGSGAGASDDAGNGTVTGDAVAEDPSTTSAKPARRTGTRPRRAAAPAAAGAEDAKTKDAKTKATRTKAAKTKAAKTKDAETKGAKAKDTKTTASKAKGSKTKDASTEDTKTEDITTQAAKPAARAPRRRRVTAAQAAPEADPAPEAAGEPEVLASPTDVTAEATVSSAGTAEASTGDDTGTADSADSPDEEGAAAETAETAETDEAPRLPAASLLFQAPDPSRARRRRKVTAVQAAPQAAPEVEDVAPAAPAEPAAERSQDQDQAPATPPASRGRRRRKVTASQATPEAAPAPQPAVAPKVTETTTPEPDESETTEPDATETEETAASEAGDSTDAAEGGRRKRRRGGRGRRSRSRSDEATESAEASETAGSTAPTADSSDETPTGPGSVDETDGDEEDEISSRRRRRRRSRSSRAESGRESRDVRDEVTALKGSTRLEAKRQRRREGRAAGRRRPIVTEAEFLARRESVDRQMIIREQDGLNQIAVLEDGLLVEHYVARHTQTSMVGNVYVGRVQNVLPSMEAAFVDLGKGRNAVLYAGEVNWDAAGMEGKPRRIEDALSSGDTVLVQVTKDPIGHKGARLTSQVTLAGRYLVLVPGGTMTGISRKLPDTERARLKKILKKIVPDAAGVIVRTAAEGASEEQLTADVERLLKQWQSIDKKATRVLAGSGKAPVLLKGEPELAVRVVRDVFNEDFRSLTVQGHDAWATISEYVTELSPDLADRLQHWVSPEDVFSAHRIDEQLAKGFDRKVWLPSGGTLIIDRTEAMTVIDVNTGRFTGAGGTLEETVTRNNIEAAEEIVRQLRLRDIGGMIVIDFVDMVLESNRDLVLRRLVECLGRDRTRHQVTEVTSLGLVQMTRKRVGQGLVEAFSTPCECCGGRGFIVHSDPVENQQADLNASASRSVGRGRGRKGSSEAASEERPRKGSSRRRGKEDADDVIDDQTRAAVRGALAQIAAAAEHAHKDADSSPEAGAAEAPTAEVGAAEQDAQD
ncbi:MULTISPECIES: Rne/Rng family ribonuclease [Actinomyces]|uniref:Ribonuclease E n=1 Tax=Actinomyces respiraculi TaxID=2744574 RepID=A0A7T0LJ16_9ACTO|nr:MULTISPECIES: Rne/Rng family ribonuclease [Actinomyces]QPL04679.1 Rne/Rng family ribonuclease [Actinomyces respiraculi]